MSNPIFEITYTNKAGQQFSQMYAARDKDAVVATFYMVRPPETGYSIVNVRQLGGKQ
ncbi:MAG TPA: hypothetical protein VET88_11800 [Gammaproteobacteria bacterium]|nr:hypothetical protein [Gammaproteobacteria bacterium]